MSNCKTIAMCNQKGGVGKTTSTVNLGVGLAMQGKRVLLVDADPQGDLTTCLGWKDTDKIRDIPLEEIDDFPDHPFKVREDEDTRDIINKQKGYIKVASDENGSIFSLFLQKD